MNPTSSRSSREPTAPIAAVERTALAWERTGIGLSGLGALLAHSGHNASVVRIITGLTLIALAALLVTTVAPARYREVDRIVASGHSPTHQRLILASAVVMSAVCVIVVADLVIGAQLFA